MKILGFEINRSQKNAEPSPAGSGGVSIQKDLQKTEPSVPLANAFPREELGDSGTSMLHGIITEEYLPNLQGQRAMRVYDEMRKGDGTVRAAMLVTTLPIRRARWFVNPVSQDQKDLDVASYVNKALFDWLDCSWDDVVRQALLMLPFGVMPFEKVYTTTEHDGKTYVTLKTLAPRLPKSIMQWELTDKTFGIQQIRQDGVVAQIPGSKLLIFVNEKEGDNWWGMSMIRSAYKHWYYKNNFYKIDAVAFERQGLGVPMIKMPAGYTQRDERNAANAAANLRANESGYLLLPPGYEAEFMDMGSSTTRDPEKSINHHNKEILQSVLAQFLELGQTSSGGGSRALSADQSDLFLKAMEAIANTITSVINKDLIPEMVNMNFNDVTVYPKLDFNGITKVDIAALGTAFGQFVTSKAINPTKKDEVFLRAIMGLPEMTEDELEGEADEQDGLDIDNEDPDAGATDDAVIEPTDEAKKEAEQKAKDKKEIDKSLMSTKTHKHTKAPRKYDDGTGFMSWRPLMKFEEKVSFDKIENKMDTLKDQFEAQASELLNDAKDTFISKVHKALEDGDTKAVSDLEIKFVADYKKLIKDFMRQAYEYGKSNASTEMGVATPPNSADTLAAIDLLADTIAWKAAADMEAKAKISVVNGIKKLSEKGKFASVIQVVGLIDTALEGTVDKVVSAAAGLIVNQAINMGRKDTFDRNSKQIYALQRSEILDEDTCDFCLSMDGRVVSLDDSWASEDVFHNNCRGMWVEILNEEPDPPEIDGIPENLGDYYGGEPNSLVQPQKPIIRPDSPAAEEVDRRAEEKKKKKYETKSA